MSWNRWKKRVLGGLLALTAAGGCKQQLFLSEGDYADAVTAPLPKYLEQNPHDAILPPVVERVGNPSTVLDPTRPPRYVTLKECIAIALEQGNFGAQNQQQFGFKNEVVETFQGRAVAGTDAIRAFALDPAVAGADIERSLSKFDTRLISSMTWQKVDQPVAAQFLSFQQQRDAASFNTTLAKPLPTGGVAGVTFSVDYSKFGNQSITQTGFVNPNYTPRVQFSFEQPLLQLFGVEANQLSPSHPGSQLIPGFRPSGGQGVEGILVTRIRFDQARAEFERNVNFLLVNVEAAYWNLYASYYALYAQEEGLRQSYDGYRVTAARVETGEARPYDLNQARAQFELFRANVYRARGQVLESERHLRGLTGLRSDDGQRLVPVDEPNLAPFTPDFYESANEAMASRPELMLARQEVKARQLDLRLQKNLRRPDLRFLSTYDIAGLGTRLDGSENVGPGGLTPGNAFSSLANNQFNSWSLGLRLDYPLGLRDANALVRQSNMQLTRSYVQLRDGELKTLEYLVRQYREVAQSYAVIGPLRQRRQELQVYVELVRRRIDIGAWRMEEYFNLLQVQRDLADAIAQEFQAVADYNKAIAQFEFAKGTIARYNNVHLAEGPLPPFVQKRAADHIRERTEAALKLRERPAHDPAPVSPTHPVGPAVGTPFLPPLTDLPAPPPDQLPGGPAGPKMLPAPTPLPGGNPAPPAATAPRPLPTATGGNTGSPLAAPRPVPTTTPERATTDPAPEGFFEPTGTVTVPRFTPLVPTGRVPTGSSAPAGTVPSAPTTGGPTIPPLPATTGGIPPTLPPVGTPVPTAPPLPIPTNYRGQ